MEEPKLFTRLSEEWRATATSPAATAACAEWARSSAALAGLTSPAAVVARCQERGNPAAAAAILRAVLAQVGTGPWPARTVLQAVLPGIFAVARRAEPLMGPGAPWQRVDEVDQEAVTAAYERIHALAGDPPTWPANAIVDWTWQRLRRAGIGERRRSGTERRFEAAVARTASTPTAGEELAHALVDAVEAGILQHVDARLIYASRVEDRSMEELAPAVGRNAWWGWRRRLQAERLLAGAGPALVATAS